mgnify:CR=1 FL=1
MKHLKIYHNPKCSKSRDALSLINDRNIEVKVIEYLKNIPTESELLDLLKKGIAYHHSGLVPVLKEIIEMSCSCSGNCFCIPLMD